MVFLVSLLIVVVSLVELVVNSVSVMLCLCIVFNIIVFLMVVIYVWVCVVIDQWYGNICQQNGKCYVVWIIIEVVDELDQQVSEGVKDQMVVVGC